MDDEQGTKRTLALYITCKAPPELFTKPFGELTMEQQALFGDGKIPCESGKLWAWCEDCPFGEVESDDVENWG